MGTPEALGHAINNSLEVPFGKDLHDCKITSNNISCLRIETMVKFLSVAAAALFLGLASASPVTSKISNVEKKAASSFWYANMDHTGANRGYAPDLDGDYNYPVFKAVAAGASADDIQNAITSGSSGNRHPMWLASQPRVSYDWKLF